jgi:triacylglycerol lipase
MLKQMILLLTGLFFTHLSQAQVMVLIHGYHSDFSTWHTSGISRVLEQHQWRNGAHTRTPKSDKTFYTIDLPSEASIERQSDLLSHHVINLKKRHSNEAFILVGHSAGGIVARHMMVSRPNIKIDTLATIASPHMGTHRAAEALRTRNSPIGWFAPFLGLNTLNRSRDLYANLLPPRPGNLLYWLNIQPHPKAHYIAIMRGAPLRLHGDHMVSGFSQDMNHVPALKDRVYTYAINSEHSLTPADGIILLKALKEKS